MASSFEPAALAGLIIGCVTLFVLLAIGVWYFVRWKASRDAARLAAIEAKSYQAAYAQKWAELQAQTPGSIAVEASGDSLP